MRVVRPGICLMLATITLNVAVATAQPGHAPLDTLLEAGSPDTDPRYAGANIDISRKLLPEAQASQVELSATPNRPPRLDDPLAGAYRYQLARQAALAGDPVAVNQNMSAALDAAPQRARYQWWRSIQAIKGLDTASLSKFLPASLRTLAASPLDRGPFLVAAHQVALLLTCLFWTVLVAACYLGCWRHLAHDASARVLKDPRHRPRQIMPLLLPLLVLLFKPGWLGLLAVLSAPLLLHTPRWVRGLLLATWVAVLALVFPIWPALRQAVPTIDPSSEVNLLDRASVLPPSGSLMSALRARLESATDPARRNRLTVALAIQEARRGRYTTSNTLFQTVLANDPQNYPAMVGTANNTYYLGRLDAAAEAYRVASLAHPQRGEVPYNLAQVYFKKLFVPEATEALKTARSLGYAPPVMDKTPNKRDGYSAVVYPGLTAGELKAACRYEAGNYPPLVTVSSWRHLLGAPPLPLYILIGAPFVLGMLMRMARNRHDYPSECENCGTPLCVHCSLVKEGAWLCSSCGETARRSSSDLVLATLLQNKSRAEGVAETARVVRLGRLLPGSGHLIAGRTGAGWLRLSLVALGLFLLTAGWAFDPGAEWDTPGLLLAGETIDAQWLPLPAALWTGWRGTSVLVGAALLVLVWLIALIDGSGLRRSMPERYSLAPTTGTREAKQNVRAGAH